MTKERQQHLLDTSIDDGDAAMDKPHDVLHYQKDNTICCVLPLEEQSLRLWICGKGRLPHFTTVSSVAPLRSVDRKVWSRFYHHMVASVKTPTPCTGLLLPLCTGLLYLSFIMTVVQEQPTQWSVVLLLAILGYWGALTGARRVRRQVYRKIVTKMNPTFQQAGYSMEFMEPAFWTWDRMCTGPYWIQFTRMPPHFRPGTSTRIGRDVEAQQHDAQDSPYNPDDWRPLEGVWQVADNTVRKWSVIGWLLQRKSITWTFENTASERDFYCLKEWQSNWFFLFPGKRVSCSYTPQGNTLCLEQITLSSSQVQGDQVRTVLQGGEVYVPIPMSNRSRQSLYRKREESILRVVMEDTTDGTTTATLQLFDFEFVEDVPNDQDLVNMLETITTSAELEAMGCVVCQHLARRQVKE